MSIKCPFNAVIITIFPEMFPGPLGFSLAGKALKDKIWSYQLVDLKEFGLTKHKNVDDIPYGGGNGLVIRPDVLGNALEYAISLYGNSDIYYMSPRGKLLTQGISENIAKMNNIIIICGRFAGIDERVIEAYNIKELSIGDFILSGGEIACFALLDSCIRLLSGVVKNYLSLDEDSFGHLGAKNAILEYPLYTKPRVWENRDVPDVLLSGNHSAIKNWKINKSIEITKARRPDLLK